MKTMSLMDEYIKKRMDARELEEELLRLIREYNRIKNTYLIVYAGAIGRRIPDVTMLMDDYYVIFDLLKAVDSDNLDFYIETPGGTGETAEEIVRCIRDKFVNIDFIVSGEAKSAGTILVLSGDEICMTKTGSLGPIDAQIRIGRTSISAYDYMEWIDETRKEVEKKGMINPFDATMVAQISPGELKLIYHALKFAEDLVVEWLPKYKFKNWNIAETRQIPVTENMKKQRAQEIAQELTNHARWRTHGRSIKIEDLEAIGLKIKCVDDDPQLVEIVYRIQTVIRLLFSNTTTYKIFATKDAKIFKRAISKDSIPKISPITKAAAADFVITCKKCGEEHKFYAKFVDDPKLDEEYKKKGAKPFPKDNKLICNCGFEIDLSGIKNDLEMQSGKKIIV